MPATPATGLPVLLVVRGLTSQSERMASYLLVVNPTSGHGHAPARARKLAEGLRGAGAVEVVHTDRPRAAASLAAESVGRVDRVIAVGGDGTLNEVLSGLVATGLSPDALPALGFLPAGTGNAAARSFPLPAPSPGAFAAAREVLADVGFVTHATGDRPFLLWCGVGLDATLLRAMHRRDTGHLGRWTLLRRVPGVVGALLRYDRHPIELCTDEGRVDTYESVIAANVGPIGIVGRYSDRADPGDGSLDILGVPSVAPSRMPGLLASLLGRGLNRGPGVRTVEGGAVSLKSAGPVPVHVDGEVIGDLPIRIGLRHGAIRLLRS